MPWLWGQCGRHVIPSCTPPCPGFLLRHAEEGSVEPQAPGIAVCRGVGDGALWASDRSQEAQGPFPDGWTSNSPWAPEGSLQILPSQPWAAWHIQLQVPASSLPGRAPHRAGHPPAPGRPLTAAECGVKGGGWTVESDGSPLPSPHSLGCSQTVTPHPPQRPGQGLVERPVSAGVTVCG